MNGFLGQWGVEVEHPSSVVRAWRVSASGWQVWGYQQSYFCVCISNCACRTYCCIWTRLGPSQDGNCVLESVIMFLIYRHNCILYFRIISFYWLPLPCSFVILLILLIIV
ncbi:hypothetical protein QJS10_CPA06g01138 [Acorus calamus]|uniref:Uncharacterized protein n=1 Tax=Acorus calamus TaxID=4465 RepID=A0AAV9ELC3_ACOCL|nr:hypothetical protein QJS10_CPA06g01138 [Acorus calamus]